MGMSIFFLALKTDDVIIVYQWCCNQFGEENKEWKYMFGNCPPSRTSMNDLIFPEMFVINGKENITLFKLTWGDYIIREQYY